MYRYHNERMINYDNHRLVMVTKDRTGSTLTIQNASSETDSGNYTCSPDKVRPASVTVHVLRRGNSAAAVQNNERSSSSIRYKYNIFIFQMYDLMLNVRHNRF